MHPYWYLIILLKEDSHSTYSSCILLRGEKYPSFSMWAIVINVLLCSVLWWNLCGLGSPGDVLGRMCLDSFPSLNLSTLKCFQVAGNTPCLANPNRPKVTLPWSCKGLRCEHQLLCWATPSPHTWSRGTDAHNEDSDDQEMVGLFRVLLFFGASVLILSCHWELGPICLFTAQGLSYVKWWTMSAYETCD